jgi:epoxyqueuosine reductase
LPENKLQAEQHTQWIKSQAAQLGFAYCGIARAERLNDDAARLERWLNKGMHGSMGYMANHFELRVDPTKLVPGAKSVITLLFNYYPTAEQPADTSVKVSRYAYGADYHEVIRTKLKTLLQMMREHIGAVEGRGFVDSAPVLERSWAVRSGLGWVGKNGNLIRKQNGSYFFIATLIIDLALEYDDPFAADFCGSCTKCIDACPTDAILPEKIVNGSKCISYFTIELKEALIPDEVKGKFEDRFFGCDICQEVCPWNRFSTPHQHPELEPLPEILQFIDKDWQELTEEQFKKSFKHSPLKRTGYENLMRNLRFISTEKLKGEV